MRRIFRKSVRRRVLTVRLLNAVTFGLASDTLESLRLAVTEGFDSNWWGNGGAIFFSIKTRRCFWWVRDVVWTWMGNVEPL